MNQQTATHFRTAITNKVKDKIISSIKQQRLIDTIKLLSDYELSIMELSTNNTATYVDNPLIKERANIINQVCLNEQIHRRGSKKLNNLLHNENLMIWAKT